MLFYGIAYALNIEISQDKRRQYYDQRYWNQGYYYHVEGLMGIDNPEETELYKYCNNGLECSVDKAGSDDDRQKC